MKTTKFITLALAVVCTLGTSALATSPAGQGTKASKTQTPKTTKTTKTWDSQPQPLRTVGYPVVFLGRAGHSIVRSPQIVSDTLKGKRDLVSKHGLMTERNMKKGTPKTSTASKSSTANNRG